MKIKNEDILFLEQALIKAEAELLAWNKRRLHSSSSATISRIYVESLRQELATLRQQRMSK